MSDQLKELHPIIMLNKGTEELVNLYNIVFIPPLKY